MKKIEYFDASLKLKNNSSDAPIVVYGDELQAFLEIADLSVPYTNIIPNLEARLKTFEIIKPEDQSLLLIPFHDESVTEVSNLIRRELTQLDLADYFADLDKYIVMIGTELIQNSLMYKEQAGAIVDADIQFEILKNDEKIKIIARDNFGALTKHKVMEKLKRAYVEKTYEEKIGGAGLGLYMVINACDQIIFELKPGKSTQICCIIGNYKRLKDYKNNKQVSIHFLD